MKLICLLIFSYLTAVFKVDVEALIISSIEVPAAVMNGSQVTLICNYDLQGDQLYSVKWYKNYVEFYRFQPAPAQKGEEEEGSKQDFELEGINLNLPKSNSTHVYLNQTNLASEGTFKCEVSADSPSFTTIANERQMKIYVLPKQKLSIIDNVATSATATAPNEGPAKQTQLNTYNVNDILNITCISSFSKPAAQLSWLLNESPVNESSKWLARSSTRLGELVESRLTLTFRLQPDHINSNRAASGPDSPPQHFAQAFKFQSLRLRCVARLSVEFSAQTDVVLAGGAKSSNKQPTNGALPTPWPFRADNLDPLSAEQTKSVRNQTELLFRWPRPAAQQSGRAGSSRRNTGQQAEAVDPWPDLEQHEGGAGRRFSVWNVRQLRAQSEHIDQLLRIARPNQLDKPSITTRFITQLDEFASVEPIVSGSLSRDYELNDQVEFTCMSRVEAVNSSANVARKVNLKWFINNYEITTAHINAYDGAKYYYVKSRSAHEMRNRSIRVTSRQQANNWSAAVESSPSNAESTGDIVESSQDEESLSGVSLDEREKRLSVEFSSSLFQAKELNLRCSTLVEQPLIEYESKLIVSVPTNPQFIQATAEHKQQPVTRNHRLNKQRGRYFLSRQQNQPAPQNCSRRRTQISNNGSEILLLLLILLATTLNVTRREM